MNGHDLAVVQGWADTRTTLREWNAAPLAVLGRWVLLSVAITVALLAAVLAIATLSTPDPTPMLLPGVTTEAGWSNVGTVVFRNSLVLALHALACLAGFIAKSSLPLEAQSYRGRWRAVHDVAGPAAIAFVGAATVFSLGTQAYVLGSDAATLAQQLAISPLRLMITLLPHAMPELIALFLPLAAWLAASRRNRWDELLAATIATTALATPVLILSASIEIFVWPLLLRAASPVA